MTAAELAAIREAARRVAAEAPPITDPEVRDRLRRLLACPGPVGRRRHRKAAA